MFSVCVAEEDIEDIDCVRRVTRAATTRAAGSRSKRQLRQARAPPACCQDGVQGEARHRGQYTFLIFFFSLPPGRPECARMHYRDNEAPVPPVSPERPERCRATNSFASRQMPPEPPQRPTSRCRFSLCCVSLSHLVCCRESTSVNRLPRAEVNELPRAPRRHASSVVSLALFTQERRVVRRNHALPR